MNERYQFLFLEPFFSGSHKEFAQGLHAHTRHDITLITLPARFWKWRMRGAAIYLMDKIDRQQTYDGLIVSSLLSLADLKALWGDTCPPALVYFHENQLSYPLAPGESMDYQFGFTNITTALAAQRILFNSHTHLNTFLTVLPEFIRMMPDCRPNWIKEAIRSKCAVAYPGCHFPGKPAQPPTQEDKPPLIIWNHRWEHDKNPDAFFLALRRMTEHNLDFRVAVLGEQYYKVPDIFPWARNHLGERIVHYGHVSSRQEYYQWLVQGDIVISTSLQENFGISIVEAVRHGCLPLLPRRLSYPEILPEAFHAACLYEDQSELEEKLAGWLKAPAEHQTMRKELTRWMGRYAWEERIPQYDRELGLLAEFNER